VATRKSKSTKRPEFWGWPAAEIYGWFTEGFDTPDLKDAKTLLEELGGSRLQRDIIVGEVPENSQNADSTASFTRPSGGHERRKRRQRRPCERALSSRSAVVVRRLRLATGA